MEDYPEFIKIITSNSESEPLYQSMIWNIKYDDKKYLFNLF